MSINKPISNTEIRSLINLFKAVPADLFVRGQKMHGVAECASRGFVVITGGGALVDPVPDNLFNLINYEYGVNAFQLNQTFHKSFSTVRDMTPEEYFAHQMFHYFSTYGLEMFGMKARPYVPVEELELPEGFRINVDKLTVIRALSWGDLLDLIDKFAANTNSPSPRIIENFKPLMGHIRIATDDIKSFELQVIKHDMDGTVPTNPVSVLRYAVYKTTAQTLLIKNKVCREMIQKSYHKDSDMAKNIFEKADPAKMASIFLRYKPLFLAFKAHKGCAPIINRYRRLAVDFHKPMSDVSVQGFMALVLNDRQEDMAAVLDKASNRELIKLGNSLGCRLFSGPLGNPGVYSIRNGRTFVREETTTVKGNMTKFYNALVMVSEKVTERLTPSLKGKTFLMPGYMDYAVPTTEKQFIGNIPWGSRCVVPAVGAFTAGIQWFDQKGERVDIDLHLNSPTQHFGWNGSYRNNGAEIIYTGDMTAAPQPNGAAEAFWFDPTGDDFILSANLFSGPDNTEFKFFMNQVKPIAQSRNYTCDPADLLFAPIPLKYRGEHDMTIGLFTEREFYFFGGRMTNGIVPSANYPAFITGLKAQLKAKWFISELLNQCGATIINDIHEVDEDQRANVIDLTPAALDATTLLSIVDGNLE